MGPDAAPAPYARSAWLFLRALGLIFLIAFVSFWVQLPGLIGSHGIEPAAETMRWAERALGGTWLKLPTLFWLGAGDAALHAACALGTALSVLLLAGVAQRLCALALWTLYLSLVSVGGPFLSFQWDTLLLEAGLLAVFVAPGSLRPLPPQRLPARPGPLFLLRWLLFRLMLLSGLVKLTSGDQAWSSLQALGFHYWTQPLPTPLGYYANRLPAWFHQASVGVMFAVELVLPFLIFGTRRMRRTAAAGFTVLQLLIALTGNYGFFNLLALALCLPLLDDAVWTRLLPRWGASVPAAALPAAPAWRRAAFAAFAALVVAVSLVAAARRLGERLALPAPLESALAQVDAFDSINAYGLFAVMTTTRPEIQVEGSDDGEDWRPYGFKDKPGQPEHGPTFVAPHQPRLDWQMWFAALGDCRSNPWFLAFQQRLLEGAPAVLALLADNPFPDHPPRYLRTTLYQYRFTRRGEPGYWSREPVGPYCPPLMLEGGQLRRALP